MQKSFTKMDNTRIQLLGYNYYQSHIMTVETLGDRQQAVRDVAERGKCS